MQELGRDRRLLGGEQIGDGGEQRRLGTGRVAARQIRHGVLAPLPDGRSLDLPGLVIVETKSRSAATDVDRLLWRARCRPQPVSKFATGLAALRPELPHNRWARLLRGPFTPETSKEQLCAAV